ncbi:hypothetical protein ARAM_003924 [Aspergillus rambellii]|uniref:Short chain dehydrogenase/reductase family oxidoreductase n=1 Tax=Aspergillus rambellii TaxID=308745 RepID=A0A0F8VKB7_9EURO|nr:hypothetical protein ARAM_003924 [Aspergillus rambellii]
MVYAQNGIKGLALADISTSSLDNIQSQLKSQYPDIRVETFPLDVAKEEEIATAIQSAAEKFGRIDISIHGAGIAGMMAQTHELPLSEWQKVIDVNQTGVMLCDKWMVRQMLTQELRPGYEGRGLIVNVSSVMGITTPDARLRATAYTAAKHAVVALTQIDAKMYASDGIRINAICPGYVDTPLVHDAIAAGLLNFEIEKSILRRPAQADEIAHGVLFLTSRMGSYMCGAALAIDGGYTA